MIPYYIIAILILGALAALLSAGLTVRFQATYNPGFNASFSPGGIDLQGYHWPKNSTVRLSVWNEPLKVGEEIYNGPPRVLANVVTGIYGQFSFTMPFPEKIRGQRPASFQDVFFTAYEPKRRILRETKMDGWEKHWFF